MSQPCRPNFNHDRPRSAVVHLARTAVDDNRPLPPIAHHPSPIATKGPQGPPKPSRLEKFCSICFTPLASVVGFGLSDTTA